MFKQFDRFFVAYNQLDALRADSRGRGRGRGILCEIKNFIPALGAGILGQVLCTMLLNLAIIWGTMLAYNLFPVDEYTQDIVLSILPDWISIVISLFSTAGMIGGVFLVLRFFYKRSLATAGFTRPFLKEYVLGLAAGFVIFGLAVDIAVFAGTLTINGRSDSFALFPWLLIFAGFLVQGMSEELLCRGCFMLNVARKNSVLAGILCNSLAFAALHLANQGLTPLSLVNLILYGTFASLYYLWRGNIWGVAAFHSMWNFAQGNIFGILVSGGDFGVSFFTSTSAPSGTLINGGDFGLEGGLAVTIMMVLGIAFVMWRNLRRLASTPMPLENME